MPFCTSCGGKLAQAVRYCPECGALQSGAEAAQKVPIVSPRSIKGAGLQRAVKKTGLALGLLLLTVVLFLAFVWVMDTRPFPLDALKFEDAQIWSEGFSVRVTNNASIGAKHIKIRIDVLDKDRRRIDGTVFHLNGSVPPMSTRQLGASYIGLGGLPAIGEWTFTYSIEGASKTAPWD